MFGWAISSHKGIIKKDFHLCVDVYDLNSEQTLGYNSKQNLVHGFLGANPQSSLIMGKIALSVIMTIIIVATKSDSINKVISKKSP